MLSVMRDYKKGTVPFSHNIIYQLGTKGTIKKEVQSVDKGIGLKV